MNRRQVLALDFDLPDVEADYWIRIHRLAMACRFEVLLSGEDSGHLAAAREALDEVARVEDCLTLFRDTSEVVRLNERAGREAVDVSEPLAELLRLCRDLHGGTEGAFDATSTPLSRCWGFSTRAARLPAEAEIAAALARVGMQDVELDPARPRVRFRREGLELGFGSVGKGFALDRAARVLRGAGVRHALLSGGKSSALALGGRAGGFSVALASPSEPERPLARLRLRDAALGTSGAGIQFLEAGGRRYGHVIDPRSGWPAEGVLSASVVAGTAAAADALSTAFLIGGIPLAERYCAGNPGVLALVTPDDGTLAPRAIGAHPGALVEPA